MKVGFVGLGKMGWPMVRNLLRAGYDLVVYNRSAGPVERATAAGAEPVARPRGVAEAAEIVLTCLATPDAVASVYLGPNGLLEGARAGQLFCDLSSIPPSLARRLADAFSAKGATFLDAPVSGGTSGAEAGTLTIMVGGDPDGFRRGKEILEVLGSRVLHVGQVGDSSTLKMLNQLLAGVQAVAVAEMVNLAERAGMDMGLVGQVIAASSGYSRIFEGEFSKAVARDFTPGFAVDLMAKDLRIVRDLAAEVGAGVPMALAALGVFEKAGERGLGSLDISAVLQLYVEKQA